MCECGRAGPWSATYQLAITAWNAPILKRQELQARIARLEAALREYADEKNWNHDELVDPECTGPRDQWVGEHTEGNGEDGYMLAHSALKDASNGKYTH